VRQTPQVILRPGLLSFAAPEAKAEFNSRLEAMTEALVATIATRGGLIDHVGITALSEVTASLCAMGGIEAISLPKALRGYMENPLRSADRVLHAPIVGLLRQDMTVEQFEEDARWLLLSLFDDLNRYVFEAWLAYALIERLSPVAFKVVEALGEDCFIVEDAQSLELGFQRQLKNVRLPEALFKTASGEAYAYKFEKSSEVEFYAQDSKCKDRTAGGNTADQTCHRTLLLYRIEGFDSAPVLAQRKMGHLMIPDLIVEHLGLNDLASAEMLRWARDRAMLFDGTDRMQAVLAGNPDAALLEEARAAHAFQFHNVCYDEPALAPVLAPLFV
jgi:hypothetical protein